MTELLGPGTPERVMAGSSSPFQLSTLLGRSSLSLEAESRLFCEWGMGAVWGPFGSSACPSCLPRSPSTSYLEHSIPDEGLVGEPQFQTGVEQGP